jgi:RNA polymerase sigma-70 factor (ECF subfamily)
MGGMHRAEVERAYRAYGHSVHRRARQILGDPQEAHEVVQDVFVALLDPKGIFQGRSALGTFLYAATTHACLNRLRDGRNRERLLALNPGGPDTLASLRQILSRLPDDEASAAVYHHVDGMSHREVAQMLGCSRRHVGDLLASLRLRMDRMSKEVAR